MITDSLVSNSPSASLRSALLAAARSLAALTAHRAVIHYRSLGCGFALPTPYTGEAFTCGICTSHYQHNSILFCFLGCGFALPPTYTGEAFTRGICTLHYLISVIQYYFVCSASACLPLAQGRLSRAVSAPCIISVIQYYFAYSATASQCSSLT